ncbi:MAG TPA: agmatinase family protein [Nitrososphaerales archaeon]|nr:agmatinase family protein [Nitrososphaerales archaeon]
MRRAARYPAPSYHDPKDKRLVQIIRAARKKQPEAVNILGIPFDGAVLGRKGSREGPAAIRRAMMGFSNYNVELGTSLEDARVFDLGDVVVDDDVYEAHKQIESEVIQDLEGSSLLVILGGDNSISLPSLKAFERKFGEIGLIVLDSHFDLRGKISGRPTSGSAYGLAIENLQGMDPRRVVEIGIHGFLNSREYYAKSEKLGIKLFTVMDVDELGPAVIAREAFHIASKGAQAVYLSIDLDAVDLSYVSGVSAPSAGGITSQQMFELVYSITRKSKVKCADLVELAPSLDQSEKSQRVAATTLAYMIAGFASRKRG